MDARKKIQELYGIKIDEPLETINDLVREAQSVINYYESSGKGFKAQECKTCGLIFAYAWDVSAVSYCSIPCIDKALKNIGLKWNPTKPPEERWGRTVPAVVPPSALEILQSMDAILEDQHQDKSA